MKSAALRQISVVISAEAEEAAAALLEHLFHQPPSIYTDMETKTIVVSVFCRKNSEWSPAQRARLAVGLKKLKGCGLDIGPGKVTMKRVRPQDWAESWKRHFKPIEIGVALLVKPSWSKRRARKDQPVVVLDPGLSFGTGHHPTTAFCLEQLVAFRPKEQAQSFLDLGTGSGILAIAAAKLGYAPVRAIDLDPEAIRVASTNARQNGVFRQLQLDRQDLTKLPQSRRQKYDLICANLLSNLLLAEQKCILSHLRRNGILVLAGILKVEFASIRAAYEKAGLKLVCYRVEREWQSGAFVFRFGFDCPRRSSRLYAAHKI